MSRSEWRTWMRLVEKCRSTIDYSDEISCARKEAIVSADQIIRYYERELRRIASHPDLAREFANDALYVSHADDRRDEETRFAPPSTR